ncbi:MAG: hypothetical protein ACI4HQ_11240 [Acetatifactor sp.]
MAGITLEKGKRIYRSGQPVTAIHLLTKGKVEVEYPGGTYQLNKGDVIGICELCSEVHFLGYTTLAETTLLTYPIGNMDALESFLIKHTDVARLFLLSMFRQINLLLEQSTLSEMKCTSLHQNLVKDYNSYLTLIERYRIPSRTIDGLEETVSYLRDESPDVWLNTYYLGFQHIYDENGDAADQMAREPGLSLGLLRKGSLDFRKTYTVLEEQYQYRSNIANFYFHASGNDLFDLLTSLYYKLGPNNEDARQLYLDLERIMNQYENDSVLNRDLTETRIRAFREKTNSLLPSAGNRDEIKGTTDTAILQELAGSVNTILEYAGADKETAEAFRKYLNAYKAMSDRNMVEDTSIRLRKSLSQGFYALYSAAFVRSLTSPHLPAAVNMFLNFGYVDEELAGAENCITLYNLASGIENQTDLGIYTLYQWLLAIYDGKKEPSRNEFDEDFSESLRKQRQKGDISEDEMAKMEQDPLCRVKYELKNMFPQVNKMTCGRISTFCPLFSADNCIKDLNSAYVSVAQITKALSMIRSIDYSAFYRESLDYDNMDIMGKEPIHLEFLPDIILMPNVGIRGVMWQEIEGKKRNSPCRMFLSVFHMEDINTTLTRLTGEFRWELCKRIQGARWNDVSEHSLTSDYFDYVQFYRKNHDLSTEAKERIKLSLQRAKNSFKEMFVRDYIMWIMFEASGSPRLNKVARKILFSYCPFTESMAATMSQNPNFSELIGRQKVINSQRLHHLDAVIQKIKNNGNKIPITLENECRFVQGRL